MAELYSSVDWKVEIVRNELGYLTEEISKQNMNDMAWFLLAACSKILEERYKLQKELLSKRNQHMMIWEVLSLLKLGNSLFRKCGLKTAPKMLWENLLLKRLNL